jgi:DNA-3-methyladenine glycosylase
MKKLPFSFYQRANVLQIAKELIGKILVTKWNGIETSGRIVEVEAYNGVNDKASHASGGRRTNRNEIMYGEGGFAYVYLCYGIHHLFNVVTNEKETPHAILIRALEPIKGIDVMLERTGKEKLDNTLTRDSPQLYRKQQHEFYTAQQMLFVVWVRDHDIYNNDQKVSVLYKYYNRRG